MSDTPQGPGWWQASDDKWYPPPRPEMPGEGAAEPPQAPPSDPSNPYGAPGAPGAPPPGMPPSGSGPYGAPPPGQHSNRTAIFVGAGIAGALVLLLGLFLVIGNDDDNSDDDPDLTSGTSEQTEGTDETLPPDDQQQTPDTAGQTEDTTAPDDGGGDGGSGGGSGGSGSGDLPSSYSSTDAVELENGLSVVEHGFSSTQDAFADDAVDASYGVIIENSSDTLQENVTLIVTAKAADGSTLGSNNHEIAFVDAGSDMAVGAHLDDIHAAVSELEFSFGGSDDGGSLGEGSIEFTSVTTTDNDSSTDITFGAENGHNYEVTFPETTAILRDSSGGIIGGDTSIIGLNDMPADSSGGGSMTIFMGFTDADLDPEATEMWVFYTP